MRYMQNQTPEKSKKHQGRDYLSGLETAHADVTKMWSEKEKSVSLQLRVNIFYQNQFIPFLASPLPPNPPIAEVRGLG